MEGEFNLILAVGRVPPWLVAIPSPGIYLIYFLITMVQEQKSRQWFTSSKEQLTRFFMIKIDQLYSLKFILPTDWN